jgi:hypothetical protein
VAGHKEQPGLNDDILAPRPQTLDLDRPLTGAFALHGATAPNDTRQRRCALCLVLTPARASGIGGCANDCLLRARFPTRLKREEGAGAEG